MIILMTAALAAAQPVPATAGNEMPAQHMAMGEAMQHEQMKCCDCCKDMAGKHEGHAEHEGHRAQ